MVRAGLETYIILIILNITLKYNYKLRDYTCVLRESPDHCQNIGLAARFSMILICFVNSFSMSLWLSSLKLTVPSSIVFLMLQF